MAAEEPRINWEEVRRLRKERRISQQELAFHADLSLGQISRIENGKIEHPQFKTVRNLAHALGVEPEDLLEGNGNGQGTGGRRNG